VKLFTMGVAAIGALGFLISSQLAFADGIVLDNQIEIGRLPPGSGTDFSVSSGSGRAIVACVYTLNDTASAPTFHGMLFTLVGKTTYPGVARSGVAAYLLLNPPIGTHRLTLNGSDSLWAMIVSFDGVLNLDATSTAQAAFEDDITDTVTTSHRNDLLLMCESDSGAGNDAWAYKSSRPPVYLVGSGRSLAGNVAKPRGVNGLTITAGNGKTPPASLISDVLLALAPL